MLLALLSACEGDLPAPDACAAVDCGPGVCEQAGGQAVCSCPAGYTPTEQGCSPQVPQSEDDHGDTPSTATPLAPGSGKGALHREEDLDVFSFQVVAGRIYRFTCVATYHHYDPRCAVRLKSATGEPLPGRGVSYQLGYEATTDGPVYAEVRHYTSAPQFPVSYDYVLEDVGLDDHGNTADTATSISPSATAVQAQFGILGDVDFFAFDAAEGHIYTFTCDGSTRCRIRLRNAAGTVVHEANYTLSYEVAQAGRYTLETSSFVELFSPGAGGYSYTLQDMGVDDHGDDAESATELALGAAQGGRLEMPEDVDVFRFTAPASHMVRFSCSHPDKSDGCMLRLKDGTGAVIEQRLATVAYEAGSTPALLSVEVSTHTPWYPAYTYQLEDLGPVGIRLR